MANKKAKPNARHIDVFGTTFCMPKGVRRHINKANPDLVGKKPLSSNDIAKIKKEIRL